MADTRVFEIYEDIEMQEVRLSCFLGMNMI